MRILLIADLSSVLNSIVVAKRGIATVPDPLRVLDVPFDRFGESALPRLSRPPTQFTFDTWRIDCVTSSVARPILHKTKQAARFAKRVKQRFNTLQISPRIARADVINGAGLSFFHHGHNRAAVVLNINPVTHIQAIAINRNLLLGESVGNGERQKFFGKLPWPIVVTAASYDGVQSKRVMSSADQMFGRRFRRGIRTVWRKRRILSKKRAIVFRQTSHHFVGRDLHKSLHTRSARRIEQRLRSHYVGS